MNENAPNIPDFGSGRYEGALSQNRKAILPKKRISENPPSQTRKSGTCRASNPQGSQGSDAKKGRLAKQAPFQETKTIAYISNNSPHTKALFTKASGEVIIRSWPLYIFSLFARPSRYSVVVSCSVNLPEFFIASIISDADWPSTRRPFRV